MATVTIKFRDGTERTMEDRGRPGGSYSQKVSYEGGFVVVTDVWGAKTAFPAELVAEVRTEATDRGW